MSDFKRRPATAWLTLALSAVLAASGITPLALPAALVLLCYLPGAAALRLCGLAGEWSAGGRIALSVGLSAALAPVFLNLGWRFTNQPWPLLGAVVAMQCGAMALASRTPAPAKAAGACAARRTRLILAGIAALVILATLGAYWPSEWGGRRAPALIHDYIKHHAVLLSLQQRALPLGNPFYAAEAAGPTYYYHFFYLVPATLRAWAPGASIELAFGLHAAVIALSIAGVSYLIVKRLCGESAATLAAALTTVIGGYDILPVLALRMRAITLDAWADTLMRIHSLLTQMTWTPQNVQGLLIGLLTAYVMSARGLWRGWLLLGPLLGAAAVGSSVWVSAALLPGAALFVLAETAARPRGSRARLLAGAVLVAAMTLVLAAPSLAGYAEMAGRHSQGGLTWRWDAHATHAWLGRLVSPGPLANLLDLPWWLGLEFGPLLILPLMLRRETWRRLRADAGLRFLLWGALVAIVAFLCVRSDFTYNDFGQKVIMVPLLTGALLGAGVLAQEGRGEINDALRAPPRMSRPRVALLAALLIAGAPVGVLQSPLAAVRRHFDESGPLRALGSGESFLAAREAAGLRFLREQTPAGAVVQAHWGAERLSLCQLIDRQLGITELERDTEVFQPRDAQAHAARLGELEAAMQDTDSTRSQGVLSRLGVTHVFVGEIERVRWRGLAGLEQAALFERVFGDATTAVYRLR